MKMPKFILRIGFQEFAVPHNKGVSAVMTLLSDAMPVQTSGTDIEVQYTESEEARMLAYATVVRLERIPPGAKWTVRRKDGTVEAVRPIPKQPKALKTPAKKTARLNGRSTPKLNGRQALQLEFGS